MLKNGVSVDVLGCTGQRGILRVLFGQALESFSSDCLGARGHVGSTRRAGEVERLLEGFEAWPPEDGASSGRARFVVVHLGSTPSAGREMGDYVENGAAGHVRERLVARGSTP
jgi:hypothetical protein